MGEDLYIRPLTHSDAKILSNMLQSQPSDYMRFFNPFKYDVKTISEILASKQLDIYMGVFYGSRLVAFFMLRGWDQGYTDPAYGVAVDQAFAGQGLGRVTIELAKLIARTRGAPRLMLKVSPDNIVAKRLYEQAGFVMTGEDSITKNLVYHCYLHYYR